MSRRMYLYYAGILLYGSILPFNFQMVSYEQLLSELSRNSQIRLEWASLEEMLVNYCLYVPLGFFIALSSTFPAKPGTRYLAAALFGFVISASAELLQGFLPGRYASYLDVFLNTSGAIAGAAVAEIWAYGFRSSSALTIRLFPGVARIHHVPVRRFNAMAALWFSLLYSVLLFCSFVSFPASFVAIHEGLPQFFQIPFTDFQKLNYLQVLRNGTVKLLMFLPLGFCIATCVHTFAETHCRRVKMWRTLIPFLIFFCLLIEWLQLGIPGKTASISDSCFYLFGVFSGTVSFSLYREQVVAWRKAARRLSGLSRQPFQAAA